jgi:hypothetical protein
MEDKARMPVEPGTHPGVLVGGVIVEDDLDDLAEGDVGFDRIEKENELLDNNRRYALKRVSPP